MNFGEAMHELLEDSQAVTNLNWNGKGMYLAVCRPNDIANSGLPNEIICIYTPDGKVTPWTPSQMDMFSDKWEVM